MKELFSCGKRIRELRNQCSLSQERLALNAGISPAYLGLVERDQKNATIATIEKICGALNISLAEFFSTAHSAHPAENDIDKQILSQLTGLNETEKQAILQLVKDVLNFRQVSIDNG